MNICLLDEFRCNLDQRLARKSPAPRSKRSEITYTQIPYVSYYHSIRQLKFVTRVLRKGVRGIKEPAVHPHGKVSDRVFSTGPLPPGNINLCVAHREHMISHHDIPIAEPMQPLL